MGNYSSSISPDAVDESTPGDFAEFIRDTLQLCETNEGEALYDKYFLTGAYFGPFEPAQEAKRKELRDAVVGSAASSYLPWLKQAKRLGEAGMVNETEHREDLKVRPLREGFFRKVTGVTCILALYKDHVQR
jgi:hypothetical protein